ncbi:MAG: amino acid permease [Candidatus Omnitrophica bacterium]|nr:amino acid permease [Candidatus Omnitrophota bacterium]
MAILIGIVIGVGIFRVPAEIATYLPSPELIILVWFVGGVFSLIGAGCYAELSSSFPQTGGDYIYLRKSYGPLTSFLYGWTCLLVIRTGAIATVSFIFAEYCVSFLSLDRSMVKPVAVSIVFLISFINMLGIRKGKHLQNISSVAKVAILIGIMIAGLLSGKGHVSNFHPLPVTGGRGLLPLFGLAMIPVLWTYGGWHDNTYVTGETKDAGRVLPLALITGTAIITLLYICMNLIYIYLVPVEKMAASELIVSDMMRILFGMRATRIVEALVIISALGCINGMIMTSSRITYAMGRDNPVFRYLGTVHERFRSPARSIIMNALWSSVLILWGTFTRLLFFTGVLIWLFFGMIAAGVFILRRRFPHIKRPHKVWGYPVTPLIFILGCAGLVVNTMIYYPFQSLIGICLMMSGIPVYLVSKKFVK